MVETVAIVENKGLVRHYINDFSFDLLYLKEGDQLKVGDRENKRASINIKGN